MPDSPRMYPVWLCLAERACVVVGGGAVAARKVADLVACGAQVRAVSPTFVPELLDRSDVERVAESFRAEHLDAAVLVIAATDVPSVNADVVEAARRRGVLVNVVDQPASCDFIVPATVSRGPVTWAVSTHGASPALARRLRQDIEDRYDAAIGQLADLLREVRPIVRQRFSDPARRRRVFESLSEPTWADRVRTDGPDATRRAMMRWIESRD